MFERWTDRARRVMALANLEAQRWDHPYVAPEHILLGLLRNLDHQGGGVARKVTGALGIDPREASARVQRLLTPGAECLCGKLPRTPGGKRVIQLAMNEAANFNHRHVGEEHLLLGLLLEAEGIPAAVLGELGATIEKARAATLEFLPEIPRRETGPE